MWPLYFLLNKILKTEEEIVHGSDGDHSSLVESYPFEQSSSNGKCHDAVLPRLHLVEVPHINQLCSWDCGLACVLMVLETIGVNNCNIQTLSELCCTTSIWTVDLAYLLQNFFVSFSYFTVTFGANPNYSVETFYKDQLPTDLVRVDTLFQKAVDAGINIQCRSIGGKEISLFILSGKYIAIALVDQYKLRRSWLEDVCVSGTYGSNSDYTGHYIVICGYDSVGDEFEIRDPASSRRIWSLLHRNGENATVLHYHTHTYIVEKILYTYILRMRKYERVSSKCLEEARKSFGTDEDLLLISLEKSEKLSSHSVQLSPHVNTES